MSYFNTTHIRGQALAAYEAKADDQERMIERFFFFNPTGEWTPEDIFKHHPDFGGAPLTSIRRAFTNLQTRGIIFKTDNQIDGMYGRPIYTWRKRIKRPLRTIIPREQDILEEIVP